MTQALANITNNIPDTIYPKNGTSQKNYDAKPIGADDSKAKNFDRIIDKQISYDKNNGSSLKNNSELKDMSVNSCTGIGNLKEAYNKAQAETKMEEALNLTLSKDINEIIKQLKEAVEATEQLTEESETEEAAETVSDYVIPDTEITEESDESITDLPLETDSLQAFEQLITGKEAELIIPAEDSAELNGDSQIAAAEKTAPQVIAQTTLLTKDSQEIVQNLTAEETKTVNVEEDSSETESPIDEKSLKELHIESIESEEAGDYDSESLLKRQSPEEYGAKAALNRDSDVFDIKIDRTFEPQKVQTTQAKPAVNTQRIIEQVAKQLEGLTNSSKVNITLNPATLGKVTVELVNTRDGLSAQFTVATNEAREAIMKGLDGLKETLLSHGVNMDNVNVKLADTQKSAYNEDWTEQENSEGGNKNHQHQSREEKEKGLFEKTMNKANQEGKV